MNTSSHLAVITTIGHRDAARKMASVILERQLAACVHISEIESFYTWNHALQNDTEYRLTFKTTFDNYPALENAIRELHSYELPAIYALQLDKIDAQYAAWIDANVI